jgi:DNA-directed RNA polymerase subunit RPC12/RpoP
MRRTTIDLIGPNRAEHGIFRQHGLLENRMSREKAGQTRIKALNNVVPMRTVEEDRCPNCQSRDVVLHYLTELYLGPGLSVEGVGAHCNQCGRKFMARQMTITDVLFGIAGRPKAQVLYR